MALAQLLCARDYYFMASQIIRPELAKPGLFLSRVTCLPRSKPLCEAHDEYLKLDDRSVVWTAHKGFNPDFSIFDEITVYYDKKRIRDLPKKLPNAADLAEVLSPWLGYQSITNVAWKAPTPRRLNELRQQNGCLHFIDEHMTYALRSDGRQHELWTFNLRQIHPSDVVLPQDLLDLFAAAGQEVNELQFKIVNEQDRVVSDDLLGLAGYSNMFVDSTEGMTIGRDYLLKPDPSAHVRPINAEENKPIVHIFANRPTKFELATQLRLLGTPPHASRLN